MKIGSKGHYGLLALAELAANYRMRRAVQVKEIASNQNIPSEYLGQIMVLLKRGSSGTRLARPSRRLYFGSAAGDDFASKKFSRYWKDLEWDFELKTRAWRRRVWRHRALIETWARGVRAMERFWRKRPWRICVSRKRLNLTCITSNAENFLR